ncbi:MAG: hypothetical protein ACOC1O_00905 [bacterium]
MAGSTETFLNLSQGLAENLDKGTNSLNKFNDKAAEINDHFNDINEETQELTKETGKWGKAFSGVLSGARNVVAALTVGFGAFSFADAITDTARLHQNMTDLSYQMGFGGEQARNLENAVSGVQRATGETSEEVERLVTTLIKLRVPVSDIQQLSTDMVNFGRVTGASSETTSQMVGELSRMGGLGQESISGIMANIVAAQREFGITSESVGTLTENITQTTHVLRNMGKSVSDIEDFQEGAIKLAGAFESVGVKADEASQIIDRLLDPGKIEDNAFLYSQLGISIQDAIEGNINPDEVAAGLQGIGAELQNMAGPQAAAMADALGMPLQQLRQMGNMDLSGVSQELGLAADGSEALSAASGEQATTARNLSEMWEKVKGTIGNIALKLMPIFDHLTGFIAENMDKVLGFVNGIVDSGVVQNVFSIIGEKLGQAREFVSKIDPKIFLGVIAALIGGFILLRRRFRSVATDTSKTMEEGMTSAFEMSAEKGAIVFQEKMKVASRKISEDLEERIKNSTQYSATDMAQTYQQTLKNQDTFSWAKRMNESTSQWLETVKMGSKPLSAMSGYYEKINANIKEKIKLSTTDYDNEINVLDQRRQQNDNLLSEYQSRLDFLNKQTNLTQEQAWEQTKLNKLSKELNNENAKYEKEIEKVQNRKYDAFESYVRVLSPEHKQNLLDEYRTSQSNLQSNKEQLQVELDKANERKNILEISQKILETDMNTMNIESGDADTIAKYERIRSQLAQNKKQQQEINEIVSKTESELGNVNQELEKSSQYSEIVKNELGAGADNSSKIKSVFRRVGETFQAGVASARAELIDFGQRVGKSLSATMKGVGERLDPRNWVKAIRAAGKGNLFVGILTMGKRAASAMAKGIGKAGRAVGKVVGKMGKGLALAGGAMLGFALSRSDELKETFEQVKEAFGEMFAQLGPMLAEMAQRFLPVLQNLMSSLAPFISTFISTLGSMLEQLVPVIADFAQRFLPVIMNLAEALLPIVSSLLTALVPPLLTLVNLLLPPLLHVLSFFTRAIGSVLKLIPGLGEVGDAMIEASNAMTDAANGLRESIEEQTLQSRIADLTNNSLLDANKELEEVTGQSEETLRDMTARELTAMIREQGNTSELIIALRENTEKLGESITEEALANAIEQVSGVSAGAVYSESAANDDLINAMRNVVGAQGISTDDPRFERAIQEFLMNNWGERYDSDEALRMAQEVAFDENGDVVRRSVTEGAIERVREEIMNLEAFRGNNVSESIINQLADEVISGGGNIEDILESSGIFNAIGQGTALRQRIERFSQALSRQEQAGLDIGNLGTETSNLLTNIQNAISRGDLNAISGFADEFDNIISRGDNLGLELLENMRRTAENTDPDTQGDIGEQVAGATERLYPAIVDAAGSGFVQSEYARRVTEGVEEEDEQVIEQRSTNSILTQLLEQFTNLVSLTAEQREAIEETLRTQGASAAIAQVSSFTLGTSQ